MIEEIHELQARLRARTYTRDSIASRDDLCRVLQLLEHEVRTRLAFEAALKLYLERAGGSPFAASHELRAFLDTDLLTEREGAVELLEAAV